MRSASFIFTGVSPFTTAGGSSPFSTLWILWARFDAPPVCGSVIDLAGAKANALDIKSAGTESNTTPFCNVNSRPIAASE
jgi:hypothetical protein